MATCGFRDRSPSLVSWTPQKKSLLSLRSSIVSSNALCVRLSSPAALGVFLELQFAFDYASAAVSVAVAMGIGERVVKEREGSPQNSCAAPSQPHFFSSFFPCKMTASPLTLSLHFVGLILRLSHCTALQMGLMGKGPPRLDEGGYCNSKPLSSPSRLSPRFLHAKSVCQQSESLLPFPSSSPPPIPQSNTSSSSFDPDPSVAPSARQSVEEGKGESDRTVAAVTAAARG